MKDRRKTLPPGLEQVSREIGEAIKEANKLKELAIQEEVVAELDRVDAALEQARREIGRILRLR